MPFTSVVAVLPPTANVHFARAAGRSRERYYDAAHRIAASVFHRRLQNRSPNAVLIIALCGVPLVAVIVAGVEAATLMVTVPLAKPLADAVMVVLLTVLPGVTITVAVVALASTETLAGTLATLGLLLTRFTTLPLAPAGMDNVIVSIVGVDCRFIGFGVRMICCAVMVTVAGLLFRVPSFTINCAT